MGNVIFPFRTPPKPPSVQDTIKDIEVLKITVSRKTREIETRRTNVIASALSCRDKQRALRYIKMKTMYDRTLKHLDSVFVTLEQMKLAVESSELNASVAQVTHTTTQALKQVARAEDFDQIKEEYDNIMDVIKEIDDIISSPAGFLNEEDERIELERELDNLVKNDYTYSSRRERPRDDDFMHIILE